MTTLLESVPVEEITAAGRQVRFSRVLLTLFLGLFMVPFWVLGRVWLGLADGVTAAQVGWWRGQRVPAEEITRRLRERAAPQPGPTA